VETAKWLASREHRRLVEVVEMLGKEDGGPLPEAVRRLVAALDTVSIPEWAQEHERVFGHSVQSTAPPYELEYGEEHSHRQPQELGDIAAFYQAFGLRPSPASHERVDHVVTECEFMHYLLYKQAVALDDDKPDQAAVCESAAKQFLADHLGNWGPAFALRLSRCAGLELMRLSAEFLIAWLRLECERMGVAPGALDLSLRAPKENDGVGCAACEIGSSQKAETGDGDPV
jgi:TorA maturation chaperone TorD